MSDMTARLALPMIVPGQAQKEMAHNEALVLLDAAVQACAASFAIDNPPADPAAGTCWIVGDDPTGAWIGHPAELAMWTAGGWRFVAPPPGCRIWVIDAGVDARFVDGTWTLGTIAAERLVLAGIELLATPAGSIAAPIGGATIDLPARDAITAILAALRHHNLIETV